ncbi:MAG TPA: M48 family metalloprotease [Gallionellaceae bacterium]
MDDRSFDSLISRLENTAKENPQRYLVSVLAVATLGFAILGFALLFALVPALLLAGVVAIVILTGGKALIFLLKAGKLLLLLVIPAWLMLKASFQMLFARFPRPQGRELHKDEAPQLFARIDGLRSTLRGPRIHHVLLTDELNAAIVQYPRFGLFGWEENYLILGFPLLLTLSEEEALSVVAHEYGHLSGQHNRFGSFIYRFRSAWGRMQHLSEQWNDWGSRIVAHLFRWYAPYFNAYTFVLARQDEYVADRLAAQVAGAGHAAHALMRVNVAAQFEDEVFWPSINRMVADTPRPPDNRSSYWSDIVAGKLDEPSRLRYLEIASQRQTDHLDTHPALSDRLRAMNVQADESAARSLTPVIRTAAAAWLDAALPAIQAEFDGKWQEGIAERWLERHQYLDECRQGLSKLREQELLTPDQRWEFIKYTRELSPEQDVLPLLNELLQQAADHAQALYRRGVLLLERNDEAGIADLERLMEQHADATLPACEAAWRFFLERDPERAEQYRSRWLTRSNYEDRVRTEFQTLPADATLAAHDLDAETEERIRQIVQEHGKHVSRAYLLRRILKADNALHDYVLAIETSRLTLGDKGPQTVKRLSQEKFPVSVFIVHLGSDPYKAFRKHIKKLNIAPLLAR